MLQLLNKLIYAVALTATLYAADTEIAVLEQPFSPFDIDYASLKKSSIGDILSKPLPTKETISILNKRSQTYWTVRQKLKEANMPEELVFVAFTESKLAPIKTGAYAGIWQLNSQEAKAAGLKVGKKVTDERYNVNLATDAAILTLKKLYAQFGRWDLAILAYNCGDGRLNNAIKKAKSDDLDVLFAPNKKLLPRTSKVTLQRILTYYATANSMPDYDFIADDNNDTGDIIDDNNSR